MQRPSRAWLSGIVTLTFLLAVLLGAQKPATKEATFRAGAAAVDISPTEFPLHMPGGFSENLAEKVHDPLYSRAIVLDDGSTAVALVLVDNLGVAAEVVEEAKALAVQRCPLKRENILVSSTHTHSAPPSNAKQGRPAEVAYRQRLIEGIAESIVKAHQALRPATVGSAAHPVPEEVFNRRWFLKPGKMPLNPFGEFDLVKMNPPNSPDVLLHPAGPTDPDVSVL